LENALFFVRLFIFYQEIVFKRCEGVIQNSLSNIGHQVAYEGKVMDGSQSHQYKRHHQQQQTL
jgi:hypothetical protein